LAFQTSTTFNAGNRFIAQISDGNGSFSNFTNIGTVTGTIASSVGNLIQLFIPPTLPTGSNYRVRVVSTNPVAIGSDNGFGFVLNNAFITVTANGTNLCPGATIPVTFEADGNFNSNNQFLLELSNSSGNFFNNTLSGFGDAIGGVALTATGIVPQSIASSAFYRARVSASSPFSQTALGYESNYFTIFNSCFNSLGLSSGPYYGGDQLMVNVNPTSTFASGNAYIAQLSDANGSFANPSFLGSVSGIGLATISGILPIVTTTGNNYSVRVISTKHTFTSAGYYLGTISPLKIVISSNANSAAYCAGAYVKLGDMTVTGATALNNIYTVQMNNLLSTTFSSPFNVFSFAAQASGVVSVPGFTIPSTILGTFYNRSIRVVSSSPAAVSQNILGTFSYATDCFSFNLNTGILQPNAVYQASYNVNSGISFTAGNQFIIELSNNNFTTVLGIGAVSSVASGFINVAIPNSLPTGMYSARIRSTNFPSIGQVVQVYVNQVNITPGFVNTSKQYCQTGQITFDNFTVASAVNLGNNYIIQISTSQAFSNGSTYDLKTIPSALTGSIAVGTLPIPVGLPNGDNFYYYRVVSTSPAAANNYSSQFLIRQNCLSVTNPVSSYCPAAQGSIFYGNVSFNAGNNITALLSNALGNFTSALPIGSVQDNVAGGSKLLNFTIPSGLQQSSNYKIKLISTDFASESQATTSFEVKQVCIGQPGGFNAAISQCSFIPLVTVSAFGSVNPDNQYQLLLTNNAGVTIANSSLLGTAISNATGTIAFENVVLPTIAGVYRLKVVSSSPNVTGDISNGFNIANNCLGAPYFPYPKICSGSPVTASVFISSGNAYHAGNKYVIELSNSVGSFAAPTTVFGISSTANSLYATVTIASNMATGFSYKLRVKSTNPAFTSNDGNTFAIDQICLSAGDIAVGPYIGGGPTPITIPVETIGLVVNGVTQYTATMYSQNGNLIGNIGTATTAKTITGTLPSVVTGGYYYVKLTSTSPAATSYNSNFFILNPTDIKVSTVSGSYCVGSSLLGVVFSVAGSVGGGNVYALDLSDASGNFYYGYNQIGIIADNTVGVKAISGYIPLGLSQSPNYRLRIRSSNGSISNQELVNINATFECTGAISKAWDKFRSRGRVVNNSASVGLVASPNSIFSFEGATKQTVEGSTPTIFGQVALTNNAGLDIKQNISVARISLSGGNLKVDTLNTVAITSTEPAALTRTNESYVDGTLSRAVTATGVAYTFPVGTTDAYRGVEVTFSGANNAGTLAVSSKATLPKVTQPAASGAPIARYDATLGDTLKSILPVSWKVEASNTSIAGTYAINLQSPLTLPGYTDPNALRVVKRTNDTAPWTLAGDPVPVKTVTGNVIRIGRRNVSNFSNFAIAGTCANVSKVLFKPTIDVVGDEFKANLDGNAYQWFIDNVAQNAFNTRQIKPAKDGKYQVKVIVSGCPSEVSEALSFAGTNTKSEGEINKSDFRLYPNPAKSEFTIESFHAVEGVYLIELFDMLGKSMITKTVNQTDGQVFKLSVNTHILPTGVYFVKMSSNGKGKVMKLVIE